MTLCDLGHDLSSLKVPFITMYSVQLTHTVMMMIMIILVSINDAHIYDIVGSEKLSGI